MHYNNDKQCFLRSPYHGVTGRACLEFGQLSLSQLEEYVIGVRWLPAGELVSAVHCSTGK
jgi:hypothetical protein